MRDKTTGKSRGFGFVTFACSFMAEAALEAPDLTVAGKKIEARLAIPDLQRLDEVVVMNKEPSYFTNKINLCRLQAAEPDYVAKLEEECQFKRSIFVASLKETITEDDLVQYFSAFGKVVRAVKIQVKVKVEVILHHYLQTMTY
jgi:RNA recognition motif-containing protein